LCLLTETVSYSALNTTSTNFVSNSEIAVVRYAYVTIGAIVFATSVLFAVAIWQDRRDKRAHNQQMQLTAKTTHSEDETEIDNRNPAMRQYRKR